MSLFHIMLSLVSSFYKSLIGIPMNLIEKMILLTVSKRFIFDACTVKVSTNLFSFV